MPPLTTENSVQLICMVGTMTTAGNNRSACNRSSISGWAHVANDFFDRLFAIISTQQPQAEMQICQQIENAECGYGPQENKRLRQCVKTSHVEVELSS